MLPVLRFWSHFFPHKSASRVCRTQHINLGWLRLFRLTIMKAPVPFWKSSGERKLSLPSISLLFFTKICQIRGLVRVAEKMWQAWERRILFFKKKRERRILRDILLARFVPLLQNHAFITWKICMIISQPFIALTIILHDTFVYVY